ncbi:MAG TPA: hypothetical protein VHJ20_11220 [Polyangia bacterium]|nr:hypothetical protein [Polyangia bacterium]
MRTTLNDASRRATGRSGWRRVGACALVVALSLLAVAARAVVEPPGTYRLIVNPSRGATTVDRAFVAQAFLKKVRRWPDGESIAPVDLDQGSSVRRLWSNDVLSRSVDAVRTYWQQMIFSGRELPPPEMRSDAEVVEYVLRRPGGIGYVSATADLRGAKVVTLH